MPQLMRFLHDYHFALLSFDAIQLYKLRFEICYDVSNWNFIIYYNDLIYIY